MERSRRKYNIVRHVHRLFSSPSIVKSRLIETMNEDAVEPARSFFAANCLGHRTAIYFYRQLLSLIPLSAMKLCSTLPVDLSSKLFEKDGPQWDVASDTLLGETCQAFHDGLTQFGCCKIHVSEVFHPKHDGSLL